MGAAIEAGAEDVAQDGDEFEITTEPAELDAVRERQRGGRHRGRQAESADGRRTRWRSRKRRARP